MHNDFREPHTHDSGDRHERRGFGRGAGPGFGAGFGPGFGPGFGGFGPRGFMPPGAQRKLKGDVRLAILSLLSEAPFNGYGLIKEITERSGGTWRPSPGSVYPTLQQLVDEGLIAPTGDGTGTEFQLSESGRAYVTDNADALAHVWDSSTARVEAEASLHESVAKLMGVIHQLRFAATPEQRAKAVTQIDDLRRSLYGILAD